MLYGLLLGLVLLTGRVAAQTPPPAPAGTPVPDPHQELDALLNELSTTPAQPTEPPAGVVASTPEPAAGEGAPGAGVLFEFYGTQALEYASRRLPGLADGAADLAAKAVPARAVHHEDGTFSLIFRTPGDCPLELAVTHDAEGRPLRTAWVQAGADGTRVTDLFGRVVETLGKQYPGLKPTDLVMDPGSSRLHTAPDGEPEFHGSFVFRDARRPFGFRVRVDRRGEVLGHDRIFSPRVIQDLRDSLAQVLEADGAVELGAAAPVPDPGSLRLQPGGAVVGVYRWPRGGQGRAVALIWREGQVATRPLATHNADSSGWVALAR